MLRNAKRRAAEQRGYLELFWELWPVLGRGVALPYATDRGIARSGEFNP
jgi:hypothetical protein